MIATSPMIAAALIVSSQAAPNALEVVNARGSCYDAAYVGRIVEVDGFESLNDLFPASDESMWWGGISSAFVRKHTQVVGHGPKQGWVKIIMSAQPLSTTDVLLFTKAHASGVPIVVHWTTLRKAKRTRVVAKALADSPVDRCS